MLKNLGERVLQVLGAGKEKFLDFDEKYANALYKDNYAGGGFLGDMLQYGHASPLRDQIPVSEYEAMGGLGPRTSTEQIHGKALDGGIRAANVLSRYALPAGGAVALQQAIANLYDGASDIEIL